MKQFRFISIAALVTVVIGCAVTDHSDSQTTDENNSSTVTATQAPSPVVAEESAPSTSKPENDSDGEKVVITGSRIKATDRESLRRQYEEQQRQSKAKNLNELLSIVKNKKKAETNEIIRNRSTNENTEYYLNSVVLPKYDYRRPDHVQVFKSYGVNPTILTEAENTSTFAMDVDDGSYKLAINMLKQGHMPHQAGIRVEEFVNAFQYRYQESQDDFAFSVEAMPSPFRSGYHVLHVGIQTKGVSNSERKPANLVLVADVSGSMASDQKLDLLKQAMKTLVSQLREDDYVALVTYSDHAQVALPPTSAAQQRYILTVIDSLHTQGSTNAVAGITLGYDIAQSMRQPGMNNRVILTSDGMANVGATTPEAINDLIGKYRRNGIFLTTVGVGVGMYNDYLLEQLANKGNGHYLYLADWSDIQSAFVDKLTQQVQTVAKNAKIQVTFNEEAISHYRLLGYENRKLNKEDFTDASKDGGELGAGHRVTALYEIKLSDGRDNKATNTLGKVAVAYQQPEGQKVRTISKLIPHTIVKASVHHASSDLKLSAAVAAFAEKLRQSYWSRAYDYSAIQQLVSDLPASYRQQTAVSDLALALHRAQGLDHRRDPYHEHGPVTQINFDHVPLLK